MQIDTKHAHDSLFKNVFGDMTNTKDFLKAYIELDDDRKIMLFEYITLKGDITEKKFNEIITELKGDEVPSLAEIWMERGEKRGEERGKEIGKKIGEERGRLNELYDSIKRGLELKFQQIGKKLFLMTENIKEVNRLKEIQDALFLINDADEFEKFIKKQQL